MVVPGYPRQKNSKITIGKRAGGMTKAVRHLPSNHKALRKKL
jgi:hypothetical protein